MKDGLLPYLKENAVHGAPEFPMGFYHCSFPEDFAELLAHWHEELEFTLIRSGGLQYTVGLESFSIKEGDLLLILPNTLHAALLRPGEAALTDSVLFHLRMLTTEGPDLCTERYVRPLLDDQPRVPTIFHPGEAPYGELLQCFEALWRCRRERYPHRALRAKRALLGLVEIIWRCAGDLAPREEPRRSTLYEEKLKLALSYIQTHYAENITVADLAELCGFSQSYFMSVFRKYMNCSSIQYINDFRLSHAAMMLLESDASVMQAALDNGFQNISYFNRMFKQKYRMTPREYRKRRAEEAQDLSSQVLK